MALRCIEQQWKNQTTCRSRNCARVCLSMCACCMCWRRQAVGRSDLVGLFLKENIITSSIRLKRKASMLLYLPKMLDSPLSNVSFPLAFSFHYLSHKIETKTTHRDMQLLCTSGLYQCAPLALLKHCTKKCICIRTCWLGYFKAMLLRKSHASLLKRTKRKKETNFKILLYPPTLFKEGENIKGSIRRFISVN